MIEFNVLETEKQLNNLKNSTSTIESIITEIQDLYNNLDDKVWFSQEKKYMDENLISYIEERKTNFVNQLNEYNEAIRLYNESYKNIIGNIAKGVHNGTE
jgi:hypothetical protein